MGRKEEQEKKENGGEETNKQRKPEEAGFNIKLGQRNIAQIIWKRGDKKGRALLKELLEGDEKKARGNLGVDRDHMILFRIKVALIWSSMFLTF